MTDIVVIDPSTRVHNRDGGVLKREFGELKSLYVIRLSCFEASGQGNSEGFVPFAGGKNYIMYAFCFLKAYLVLQPLAARALQTDAQREEGIGIGVNPEPFLRRKRKREPLEINIVGMESLSSVFMTGCARVAEETESAERDHEKFQAFEARSRSTQALLTPISQAKKCSEMPPMSRRRLSILRL